MEISITRVYSLLSITFEKRNLLLGIGIALIGLPNCSFNSKNNRPNIPKSELITDTIQGVFLYEVNVPLKSYTRFDQIEQGNNIVIYDSLIDNKEINEIYEKGVFIYQPQPFVYPYFEKHSLAILQNKDAIKTFEKSIFYLTHREDSIYNSTLFYDKNKILSYKKFFAKLAVIKLGKVKQLVPNTRNFSCCYSNTIEEITTFFIVDIFDFRLY